MRVADGVCTAVLGERSSDIPCGELGYVGLYTDGRTDWQRYGLLDWLAPRTAWRDVFWHDDVDFQWRRLLFPPTTGWQRVVGEWRHDETQSVMRWPLPEGESFVLEGILRRPYQKAGILLLEPNGAEGWLFVLSGQTRQGVWWRWQAGQPVEPLGGIPFEKPLLGQGQALLRLLLRSHQVALMVALILGWGKRNHSDKAQNDGARPHRHHSWLVVVAVMVVVLLGTGMVATDLLQRMPHVQDSVTYLFQAETLARGQLWAPAPPEPEFFEQEFLLVQNGRWFGKYPPGYPLLLALGVLVGLPWLVNPVLAMLTVLLFYLLARDLYGRSTGLWAILLLATSPFFLFMSGSLMLHTAELFWVVLAMWAWLRAVQLPSWRWLVLAGLALGMLFLTRQVTAVLLAVTFMAAVVGQTADWRFLARQLLVLGGVVGLFVLLLLGYQTAVTGSPFTDPRLLFWEYDRLGFGDDVGEPENAFTVDLVENKLATSWYWDANQPPRGHTPSRGLFNTGRNWQSLLAHLYGWPPLLTMLFVWLLWLHGRPQWPDMALLLLLMGVVGVYVAYWAAGIMYGPRYYYAALPALILLTARGIVVIQHQVNGRVARGLMLALLLALLFGNLFINMPEQWDNYRGYNFVSRPDLSALATTVSGPAVVFVPDEGGWWEYGRYFSLNSPWLDGRFVFARDLGDEANGRLLAHFPNYQVVRWREDGVLEVVSQGGNS